jgi:hypothetical protein
MANDEQRPYPEDALTLLGPAFEAQTSATFGAYVRGLYAHPTPRKAALPIKGRCAQTATKKRPGRYELTHAAQAVTADFEFDKTKTISAEQLDTLEITLRVPRSVLESYLRAKKFTLTAGAGCESTK